MKSRLLIYLPILMLLGITFFSCEKDEKESKPVDQISNEAYNIYSLVINEHFSSEKIVIAQSSYTMNDLNENHLDHLDFNTRLVQIHEDLNENSVDFEEKFYSDTKEIILITSDELSTIFDHQDLNAGWEKFHNEYENSGGLVHFSRVAINEDNTQAVFEIANTSASLGGGGEIVCLKKQDGHWTIISVIPTWIS